LDCPSATGADHATQRINKTGVQKSGGAYRWPANADAIDLWQ
jgi:hypothetical protein